MSSIDSVPGSTKDFLNELNQLLREHNHYIDFINGALFSLNKGYVGVLEDSQTDLYLIEEESGEILYESESNN